MRPAAKMLTGALLAAIVVTPAAQPGHKSGPFPAARHEVSIGEGPLTALTGFLLGGSMADLAVVSPAGEDSPRLRIYSLAEGTWTLTMDQALSPDLAFVDLVRIGDTDHLLTYAPGRLAMFLPESGTERPLTGLDAKLSLPPLASIPHVNITEDVNGDGREDLVIPVARGFAIHVQTETGEFEPATQVGVRPHDLTANDVGYRLDPWAQGRVFTVDIDLDGYKDLVYWHTDRFEAHIQNRQGGYAASVMTFASPIDFDSDDLAALAAPGETRQRRGDTGLDGAMNGRVLHSLADMNGDGVTDLVIFTLAADSGDSEGQTAQLWRMQAGQEVHLGTPAPGGGIAFSPIVSAAISFDGIPFGWDEHELDGDGRIDLMLTGMDPGVFKAAGMIISALFTRSLGMHLEMYRLTAAGYPAKPTARRKIRVGIGDGPETRAASFPVVVLLDANGDDRLDLLIGKGRKTLQIYDGIDGPGLFARQAHEVVAELPADEEHAWLDDLDGDGREDLVLYLESAGEPDRVSLLLTPPVE